MNGIEINIKDFKVPNDFDMVKVIAQLISVTKNITFSDTELFALTFFIMKGYTKITKEELVTNKLLKTHNAVANLISKFRKYGLLTRTLKGEELISDYNFYREGLQAIKFNIIVKK